MRKINKALCMAWEAKLALKHKQGAREHTFLFSLEIARRTFFSTWTMSEKVTLERQRRVFSSFLWVIDEIPIQEEETPNWGYFQRLDCRRKTRIFKDITIFDVFILHFWNQNFTFFRKLYFNSFVSLP